MKFRPSDLGSEPITLEESVPPAILELDEKSIRVEAPIEVQVTIFPDEDGKTLIIQGSLKTEVKLECGRCLDWLNWPLEVPEFMVELEKPLPLVVDLTPCIREDIILHLPFNSACRLDDQYRCPLSGKVYPPVSPNPVSIAGKEVWQELDKLKIKE
jgi:uncharacterized metal-binding protein YceD (DUF177 family)